MYKKITVGFVIQNYDENGKCIDQEFIAGDDITYEDEDGDVICDPYNDERYSIPDDQAEMPFDMVQPQNSVE